MVSNPTTKRFFQRFAILLLVAVVLVLGFTVGGSDAPPAPPSSEMEIHLPDGTVRTLGEILNEAEQAGRQEQVSTLTEVLTEALSEVVKKPKASGQSERRRRRYTEGPNRRRTWLHSPDDRDPYRLGRELAAYGDINEAIALLRSVPKTHERYARSQRYVGWDLYTQKLNQPRIGLSFIQESIHNDPFSGNAWEDGYRTLLHVWLPADLAKKID
ncbi:MAG: hypothetical protein H8E15_07495 [Planctomycetes bacterium]|nr:hypothetical protein [Planctomycetota bacterium]